MDNVAPAVTDDAVNERAAMEEMMTNLREMLGEEAFAELQEQTYCYRILTSMYYLDTLDPVVIAQDIYEGYDGKVEADKIAGIVQVYFPIVVLEYDTFDSDGNMTEDAIQVAINHNEFLNLGKVKDHHEFRGFSNLAEAKPAIDKHLH